MQTATASTSLLEQTLQLVRNRPRSMTYDHIAAETGLKKTWLEAFAAGRIPDPGVRKVEALHAFLSK